jgi:hypothetical protein
MNAKHELVRYLLERGLLSHAAVVDGDVTVVERARRHTNFTLLRRNGPGLFIKQMRPDQHNSAQTLQKEAALYGVIGGDPAFAAIDALMPRFHAYDPEAHLLIVELLAGAEDVNEHHARVASFPLETARLLGAALAKYQLESRRDLATRPSGVMFPRTPPWILSFHTFPPNSMQMSGANGQFASILRGSTEFAQSLDELRAAWRYETLIHGDMKFENCMLTAGGLRIVDWELADVGDPLWDAGSILQAYLTWWIGGMQLAPGAPLMLSTATHSMYPLAAIRPAIGAFWSEYAAAWQFTPQELDEKLDRTMRYAGARLLQTVYESSAYSQSLAPHAMLEVQASMNMLRQPRLAAVELVGARAATHV